MLTGPADAARLVERVDGAERVLGDVHPVRRPRVEGASLAVPARRAVASRLGQTVAKTVLARCTQTNQRRHHIS